MRALTILAILIGCGTGGVRAQPAVSLEAVTDHQFYREIADSQVYLEARIAAPSPASTTAASPSNVAFVLDRSGSMAGEPIAALRAAAASVVASLSDRDFVAIVAFGSEVETVIEAQRRDRLGDVSERLAQIEPAGGAALYDALNQAAAQVRRNASPTAINRIILVTDGPPTKGPRATEDFTRLAEVFAGEGILFSTVGFGPDFNEDALAAMARAGQGHFRYVAQPAGLKAALQAELGPPAVIAGYDGVLTVEFNRVIRKIRSHSWRVPSVEDRTLTWRFPRLLAEQPLSLLVSGEIESFHARFGQPVFATVKLRWKKTDGEAQELTRIVPVNFTRDSVDIRESFDAGVARAAAAVTLREGLQRAIEELDRGDPRRALRALRTARGEARDLNFDLADPRIVEMVRRFDGFLTEAQARVLGPADRKIFRSGLLGEFEPAAEIVAPKN